METLALLPTGTSSCTAAPDGIITVSELTPVAAVFCAPKAAVGDGLLAARAIEGGRDEGADGGTTETHCCDAMASCSKQRTSSADARSTGACPS